MISSAQKMAIFLRTLKVHVLMYVGRSKTYIIGIYSTEEKANEQLEKLFNNPDSFRMWVYKNCNGERMREVIERDYFTIHTMKLQ
jgi:hypothetical protein